MLSDPRSIAFVVDLVDPRFQPAPKAVRKLYARMVESDDMSYANLNLAPVGGQMTTIHGPAGVPGAMRTSSMGFYAGRLRIEEMWTQLTPDDFIDRATRGLDLALGELGIASFPSIQCTVQSLIGIQGVEDTRAFFDRYFFDFDEADADRLGRSPSLFGLRMVFPATEEDRSIHNLRVESFQNDVRSLFLEEVGLYQTPVTADDLSPLTDAFRASYEFLSVAVPEYLRGRMAGEE